VSIAYQQRPTGRLWTLQDLADHYGPIPMSRVHSDPPPGLATEEDLLRINAQDGHLCELDCGMLIEKRVADIEGVLTPEDLLARFGPIPLSRIRTSPPPGKATAEDAIRLTEEKVALCEFVDGILVEKTMGMYESGIAVAIASLLYAYVSKNHLGVTGGEACMMKVLSNRVRMPDVCFISFEQFPHGKVPREAAPRVYPDFAVEVISSGNTRKEMDDKLHEYFAAGTRLVWYVYPDERHVHVYTSLDDVQVVTDGTLTGEPVLPGFEISLDQIFHLPGWPKED